MSASTTGSLESDEVYYLAGMSILHLSYVGSSGSLNFNCEVFGDYYLVSCCRLNYLSFLFDLARLTWESFQLVRRLLITEIVALALEIFLR
jgi:hypothetical protein